eukprot:TRINITY_DN13195_c0_g1_i3.p1 TRINITY_DN13195_c0_g1~~TRINITY_DN13195_c0_g1_i3.p1  ORF type:complete len:203 (+),score=30.00 TRINITY_DN13195_c0_g1_i3:42-611(+)
MCIRDSHQGAHHQLQSSLELEERENETSKYLKSMQYCSEHYLVKYVMIIFMVRILLIAMAAVKDGLKPFLLPSAFLSFAAVVALCFASFSLESGLSHENLSDPFRNINELQRARKRLTFSLVLNVFACGVSSLLVMITERSRESLFCLLLDGIVLGSYLLLYFSALSVIRNATERLELLGRGIEASNRI